MTKPVILLVEDEVLLLLSTSEDLEDLGYAVMGASNAQEALACLDSDGRVDLLMTDIRMAGLCDGWELARRARQLRPDLPILYVSGYTGEEPQLVAGSAFLSKPYRLDDVEKALRQLGIESV